MNNSKKEKQNTKENPQKKTKRVESDKIQKNKDISEDAELIENLPPEARAIFSMQRFSGHFPSPVVSKINEKHIDKIIENADKDEERQYKDKQQKRKYSLVCFLLAIGLFVFLTIFLAGKDIELLKKIIEHFVVFIGGLGAGYGYKTYIDRGK